MKNFDWNGFEKGDFEVKCNTKEEMNDFLSQCEERGYLWISGVKPTQLDYYCEGVAVYFDGEYRELAYEYTNALDYVTWVVEETEESTTQKEWLNWREVFTNIQEGETYVWGIYSIALNNGRIIIGREGHDIFFDDKFLFTKKQETVDFNVAYQALKEGKIIQSVESGFYFKIEGVLLLQGNSKETINQDASFEFEEIEGQWLIID